MNSTRLSHFTKLKQVGVIIPKGATQKRSRKKSMEVNTVFFPLRSEISPKSSMSRDIKYSKDLAWAPEQRVSEHFHQSRLISARRNRDFTKWVLNRVHRGTSGQPSHLSLLHLLQVEVELLALKHVAITAARLTWTRCNASCNSNDSSIVDRLVG